MGIDSLQRSVLKTLTFDPLIPVGVKFARASPHCDFHIHALEYIRMKDSKIVAHQVTLLFWSLITLTSKLHTSAQPPSSSLYDASLSGLSGLSTSFTTRSSARPEKRTITRSNPEEVSHNTFAKKHSCSGCVRQDVASNGFQRSSSDKCHSCARISCARLVNDRNQ